MSSSCLAISFASCATLVGRRRRWCGDLPLVDAVEDRVDDEQDQDAEKSTNDTGISKKAMSIMHCMCVDMFKRIAAEVRGHV